MDDAGIEVAVGGYVSWIQPKCFKSINIDWPLKDTVVVIVPVFCIENTIVVVVEWVSAIASVESLEQVVNTVVVIVKIVQIIDSVVVVIVLC